MSISEKQHEEVVRLAETYFCRNRRVQELFQRQEAYKRQGMWMQALEIGKELDVLHDKAVADALRKAREDAKNLDLEDVGIHGEDKRAFQMYVIRLLVCCDIIDGTVKDINTLLKAHDKDLSYDSFGDIVELHKYVKAKLNAFSRSYTYLQMPEWGAACDNMEKMMESKVKKIYNKYNNL